MKELYNNSRLRTKLMVIYGISSLLPILIILIISARLNTRNMTDKVDELMITNLTQIAERVNLNLEIYANLLYQIYQDEELNENIRILQRGEGADYAVAYNRINDRLKQYNTVDSNVRCISVICSNGMAVVHDFDTDSSINHLWKEYKDLRLTEPYMKAEGQPGMVLVSTSTFEERTGSGHYFHIAKRVFDLENLETGSVATVVISVDVKALDQICNASNGKESGAGINFIMDADNRIISYPDEDFSGLKVKDGFTVKDLVKISKYMNHTDISVNSYEDPITGWIFYNAYDRAYMLRDVTNSLRLYVTIGIMAVLLATVAILGFVRQINRSVDSVVEGILQVQEGNLDARVQITCGDEIGKIAENFNQMTVQVKNLIQEVKTATDKQKNAEIRALEAQINPHFLYNTLDSINWMAIEKEEYEISRMIRNLGIILRYSVDKSNSIVTVQILGDWLEKYISLQQVRFNNIFYYEVHVEDRAKDKRIHKLLLQPFVENAILHGLKDKEDGGVLYVDISLSEDGDMFYIIIEDNGKGMPEGLLAQYNAPERAVIDDGRSIGMHNAFSRMRMYYGEEAVWNIKSIENMGTVVTIKLPVIGQEEA